MFERAGASVDMDLRALVGMLARVGDAGDDMVTNAERVDQLDVLERVKAAAAAAQARVTTAFVVEEERVAAEWRERVRSAADADDFATWREAREEERRHTVTTTPVPTR